MLLYLRFFGDGGAVLIEAQKGYDCKAAHSIIKISRIINGMSRSADVSEVIWFW
jgi:hypothetical protein